MQITRILVPSTVLLILLGLPLQAQNLKFEEHLISNDYTYGYAIAAADLDGDGDLDMSSSDCTTAGSRRHNDIYWFENDGSGRFQRHGIAKTDWHGRFERHQLTDMNRDGRPDLVGIDNFFGDVFWIENQGDPRKLDSWKRHPISNSGLLGAYDVAVVDLDKDGHPDVAASSWRLGNSFIWYRHPGTPTDEEWPSYVVDEGLDETRAILAGDFNRDGHPDLLGSARVAGLVLWYENSGNPTAGPWRRHVIDASGRPMHGSLADMDQDGDVDVLMAGGLGAGEHPSNHQIVWYENVGSPGRGERWLKHIIDEGFWEGFEVVSSDLDQDGDLEVIATGFGDRGQIAWYENLGDRWQKHPLKERWIKAVQVITPDLNGDGWPDIAAVNERGLEFRWWKNLGVPKK
jgi:hypothetical protein